jgi:hypothetical protein
VWNNAGAIERLANCQGNGISHMPGMPSASPLTLSRTMEGYITAWSPDMEQRYGFTDSEAIGHTSRQLLRTVFLQALPTIEATLANQNSWSGILIHHRADGGSVMAVNHWHMHRDRDNQPCLVTEMHCDISTECKAVCRQLGDALAVLAHDMSEPLTALSNYVDGTQRILQQGWPDLGNLRKAMVQEGCQIARSAAAVRRLRALAAAIRDAG